MTEYDLLFWLLVILLGGIAFMIESGVATRHRKVLLTSLGSVLLSALYIMFLVEDKSSFNLGPRPGALGGGGEGGERGAFKFNNKPGKGGAGDGGSDDSGGGDSGSGSGKGGAATYKTGVATKDCDFCPSMVVVPAGKVMMGSPKEEPLRQPNEGPQKLVTFKKAFAVGRTEITREEFGAFVTATGFVPSKTCTIGDRRVTADWNSPGFNQTPKHPVVCVSWQDAKAYAAWLRKETGRAYRLLSESEWEYASRGSSGAAYWLGERIDTGRATFASKTGPSPTISGQANSYGLFDVHGNVWEITDDCFAPDPSYAPADGRPANLMGDCTRRVMKGGGWDSTADQLRIAYRTSAGEQAAANTLGFRIARDVDDKDIAR